MLLPEKCAFCPSPQNKRMADPHFSAYLPSQMLFLIILEKICAVNT